MKRSRSKPVAAREGSWERGTAGERGAAAALVVLFLPCLLVCLGLVVDLGVLLVARSQLRAAADMGALAGVQELDYERLAAGEVLILEGEAARVTRQWILANLEGRVFIDPDSLGVRISVINVREGDGSMTSPCPVTGRPLEWPTVCVEIGAVVRLPFLPFLGPVGVRVHADASVVGRP